MDAPIYDDVEIQVIERDGRRFGKCPHCSQEVGLGTAGPEYVRKIHLLKDSCKAARQKRDAKAAIKTKGVAGTLKKVLKPRLITSFFNAGAAPAPVPSTLPEPAPLPVNTNPLPAMAAPLPATVVSECEPAAVTIQPVQPARTSPVVTTASQKTTDEAPSIPDNVLDEIAHLIPLIPSSIPEATIYDPIAAFAGNPSNVDDVTIPADELWEQFLNRHLKERLGWNADENMDDYIRRGPLGVEAVLNFARYFVIKRDVPVALFAGKLSQFMAALRKCTIPASVPTQSAGASLPLNPTSFQSINSIVSGTETANPPTKPKEGRQRSSSAVFEVINVDSFEYEDILTKSKPTTAKSKLKTKNSATDSLKVCKGYAVAVPAHQHPSDAYPHGIHTMPDLVVPWGYEIRNGMLSIFANSCPRVISGKDDSCKNCRLLKHNQTLDGVLTRMEEGVHENARLAYHGMGSLREIIHEKSRKIQYLKLRGLNQAKKLLTLAREVGENKRLLMAISSEKIHRVDRVLSIGIRQKKGTRALLASVVAAAAGFYRPRGFDEEEDMRALLIWRLGGNRVAEINHRSAGAPSISYLRTRSTVPRITPSPARPNPKEVQANMEAVFASILDLLKANLGDLEVVHAVMMFDELAAERRLRYDSLSNMILGLCREHGHKTSLEFVNEDDVKEIFRLLDEGEIHYASEATVAGIGLMSEDHRIYPARPVLVSGDCKKETGREHAKVIQTVLDGVNAIKERTRIRVVSLASDGEARRGASLVQLTLKKLLDKSSPIHTLLSELSFMDYHVGDDDLTCDKDWKHVFKRLRNLLLRQRGVVVNNIRITPDILQEHLRAGGLSAEHINAVFNPKDLQDVKLAIDLLKDIWNIPRQAPPNSVPGFVAAREAIWTLGKMLFHLVYPYLCLELSLSEQIEHLSAASHMFLTMYAESGQQFIPTALYCDIQHMVKNVIFCLAKAKVDRPHSKFYIILLGTDRLEELFGILRTMVGNDANLDILQLVGRLAGTTEVANILARYPHWDRGPRRLQCPILSRDSTEVMNSADHLKPGSWRGNVLVKDVSIRTAWNRGRQLVESECPTLKAHLQRLDKKPGVTILAPRSVSLFTIPLASNDIDESLEEPQPEVDNASPLPDLTDDQENDVANRIAVEDALEADTHDFQQKIQYGNKEVAKSRVLTLLSKYRIFTASTDRLRRVKAMDRYNTLLEQEGTDIPAPADDIPILVVSDPVAGIVSSDDRLWLCIGEVNTLKLDGKTVQSVKHSILGENIVSVSYQILGLVPASVKDDPSKSYDWKTYPLPFEKSCTVPGRLIMPLDPAISTTHEEGTAPWYLFSSAVLVTVAASLHEEASGVAKKSIPVVKASPEFPYRNRRKEGCFACSEDVSPVTKSLDCPRCIPTTAIPTKSGQTFITHIAAHIKHDDALDKSWPVCGLCLQPPSLCRYFVKKGRGATANMIVDEGRSKGCNIDISWTYSKAVKSSKTSPCSNAPIICPLCPSDEPAIWRYFMQAHFTREHPRLLTEYAHLWTLSREEEEFIEAQWTKMREVKKKRASRTKAKLRIPVSEAHRAQLPVERTADIMGDDGNGVEADADSSECQSNRSRSSSSRARDNSPSVASSESLPTVGELVRDMTGGTMDETRADDHSEHGDEEVQEDSPPHAEVALPVTADSSVTYPSPSHPTPSTDMNLNNRDVTSPTPDEISTVINAPTAEEPAIITNVPSEETSEKRSKRKRNAIALDPSVQACLCSRVVDPGEENIIECRAAGCETRWYHVKCIDIPRKWPQKWYCDTCMDGRPNKRPRGARRNDAL